MEEESKTNWRLIYMGVLLIFIIQVVIYALISSFFL